MEKLKNLLIITVVLAILALAAGCGAQNTQSATDTPAAASQEAASTETAEADEGNASSEAEDTESAPSEDEEPTKSEETAAEQGGVNDASQPLMQGTQIRLAGLKGPTSMGMVKLLEDASAGGTVNDYVFTMAGSADEITPLLLKGELDIIAAPVNLASVLYNRSGGEIQLLAVNTLGVVYIVEKGGETVNSLEDLKGQTIYATGKGSTPEYALTYLLSQHGLDINTDVTMEWKSEPAEITAALSAQDTGIAMLPQPYVTVVELQVEGVRTAVDLTEEWEKLDNGSSFITAGILIRREFAEENPEAVQIFLREYEASTKYVNENVEEAAQLMEKYDIVKAAVAKKAIPYCNIVCFAGAEMKSMVEGFFEIMAEQNIKFLGEKLPGEDFYLIYE